MLLIKTPERTEEILEWEDRIMDMTVGYRLEIDKNLNKPVIIHGRETYTGSESINSYLEELREFMDGWSKCSCEG